MRIYRLVGKPYLELESGGLYVTTKLGAYRTAKEASRAHNCRIDVIEVKTFAVTKRLIVNLLNNDGWLQDHFLLAHAERGRLTRYNSTAWQKGKETTT